MNNTRKNFSAIPKAGQETGLNGKEIDFNG